MRTTHSDLTRELRRIADAMPAAGMPIVDAQMLRSAADALDAQDSRVDAQTIALRMARESLPDSNTRDEVTRALSWKPSGAGNARKASFTVRRTDVKIT